MTNDDSRRSAREHFFFRFRGGGRQLRVERQGSHVDNFDRFDRGGSFFGTKAAKDQRGTSAVIHVGIVIADSWWRHSGGDRRHLACCGRRGFAADAQGLGQCDQC